MQTQAAGSRRPFWAQEPQLMLGFLLLGIAATPLSRSVSAIAIVLVAVNWLAHGGFMRLRHLRNRPAVLLALGYLAMMILGVVYTRPENIPGTAQDIKTALPIGLLPLVVATTPLPPRRWLRGWAVGWIVSVLVCQAFFMGYAAFRVAQGEPTSVFFYHALTDVTHLHSIQMSMAVAFAILLTVYLVWTEWRQLSVPSRWVWLGLVVPLLMVFLLLLNSRMAIGALVLLLSLMAGAVLSQRMGLWKAIGASAALLAVLAVSLYALPPVRKRFDHIFASDLSVLSKDYVGPEYQPTELTIRLISWKYAFQAWADGRVLLGTGTGDVSDIQDYGRKAGLNADLVQLLNPHNIFIQQLLTFGLLGAAILVLLFAWPLAQGIRTQQWALLLVLLTVGITGLTEPNITQQYPATFFGVLFALTACADGRLGIGAAGKEQAR